MQMINSFVVQERGDRMDDFISREDTIEKMQEVAWYHQNKNGEMYTKQEKSYGQRRIHRKDCKR